MKYLRNIILVFVIVFSVQNAYATGFGESFRLDLGEGESKPQKVFFDEYLPALFERTLTIAEFNPAKGSFEWIFTGEHGGFTIRVDDSTIHVWQRFYDSFGLLPVEEFFDKDPSVSLKRWFDGTVDIGIYPEKKWFRSTAACSEPAKRITVILDHKLGLTVLVNGRKKVYQTCLMDVNRHQLRLTGREGKVEGKLLVPRTGHTRIEVNRSKTFQKMIGFGGTAIPTAYAQLSPEGKKRWWKLICEYNLLIQRENPIGLKLKSDMSNWDNLEDATPHYYGDNFPNGNISDFTYNKTIQRLGGQVWFEFWGFPAWAYKEEEWTNNKGRKQTRIVDVNQYAQAMIGYCKTAQKKAGTPPDIVGIQNEGSQLPETFAAMTLTLRRELDRAGFESVKIHMSNANMMTEESTWGKKYSDAINRAKAFTRSKEAWDAIDYSTTNMYDYQEFFANPDAFDRYLIEFKRLTSDKPFLSTEMCVNNGRYQRSSYRLALLMGELYHKNLVFADAAALLYCWTIVNVVQPSFGWTRSLFVPDKTHNFMPVPSSNQLRVFGAYSRRIRKEMRRALAESDSDDICVTAFMGKKNEMTMVILNRSILRQDITIDGMSGFKYIETVDPYNENTVEKFKKNPGQKKINISIAPGAVITLSSVKLGKLPLGFKFYK